MIIDERLRVGSIELCDWKLSRIFFKNESRFIWFTLVPLINDTVEIYQLPQEAQQDLIHEISVLSKYVKDRFQPDKINVGALGNIVPQLHVHVIGRFRNDPFWPHSIWQENYSPEPYQESALLALLKTIHLG